MNLSFKKEQLIEALEATRKVAEKLDKEAVEKHLADEKAQWKKWQEALKEAQSWDYVEAKKRFFSVRMDHSRGPTCPALLVSELNRAIAGVKMSGQQRYSISAGGSTDALFKLLALNFPKIESAC